jgi:DNA-binding LacI/PurR family transcriptional regulator
MCYNDVVALGVMSGLRRAGIEPGSEIAVSGYDNIEAAEFVSPSLTSVDVDPHEIGARAAQLLQAQIAGEEVAVEAVRVAPQLRIRESTQPHE